MKLKKIVKKKIKLSFIYIIVIYIIFSITFYYSLKNSNNINNKEFINFLLKGGNSHLIGDYKLINIVNNSTKFLFSIDFTNPSSDRKSTRLNSSHNNQSRMPSSA